MKKGEWIVTIKMNRLHVLKVEVRTRGGEKAEAVNVPVPHGQLFAIPVETEGRTECVTFDISIN